MKKTVSIALCLFLAGPVFLGAKPKSSLEQEPGKKRHAHRKTPKDKKGQVKEKGGTGADLESEITEKDVQFNAKGRSK